MSETLVIRLRAAEEAPASWLIVDRSGARSGPVHTGPLADALSLVENRSTVLLLPAGDVALAEPELPLRGGARLAQAVPFALEEQLASEVETMHFAVGARRAGAAGTPVAYVARGLMDRWQADCEAAGIHPDAAYADAMAVPVSPGACTLLLDEGMLFVRRAAAVPYAIDANPLGAALDLALGDAAEAAENVVFFASAAEYEAQRDTIEGLRSRTATLQVKLLPDGALPLLAAQVAGEAGARRCRPVCVSGAFLRRLRRRRRWYSLPARAFSSGSTARPRRNWMRRSRQYSRQRCPGRRL
jgi:general secretion pathway protein L